MPYSVRRTLLPLILSSAAAYPVGADAPAFAPAYAPAYAPEAFGGLHWRLIGPFRGGRVLTAAGIPGDSRHFYFGAVDGGVWATRMPGVPGSRSSTGSRLVRLARWPWRHRPEHDLRGLR